MRFTRLVARPVLIATPRDVQRPGAHPHVLPATIRQPMRDGRLQLAVAETSGISPGLLEGALTAGERAVRELIGRQR